MRKFIGASLMGSLLLFTMSASAVPITYDFSGSVSLFTSFAFGPQPEPEIFDAQTKRLLGLLPGSLSTPDSVTGRPLFGSFTVDVDAAKNGINPLPDLPELIQFLGFDVVSAFSVTIDGLNFMLDPTRAGTRAGVVVFGSGELSVAAELSPDVIPGSGLMPSLSLDLSSDLNPILSGRPPADLTVFERRGASVSFSDPTTGFVGQYIANIDFFTQRATVPEAGTALLFGIGMLGLLYGTSRGRIRVRSIAPLAT